MRRKKEHSNIWSTVLPRVLNAALLVCCLSNFIALAWSVRSTTPKVVRQIDSVVTNHFFTITQVVERVSREGGFAGNIGGGAKVERVGFEIVTPYHYMVVNGVPMIRFFGQNFKVGDYTSYGRIEGIFPDRVKLEGSTYLKNQNNPDSISKVVKNE